MCFHQIGIDYFYILIYMYYIFAIFKMVSVIIHLLFNEFNCNR